MDKKLFSIFNLLIPLSKINYKEKYKLTKEDIKLIKMSYPGKRLKDGKGLRCTKSRWFMYVVYNAIERMTSIEEAITYSDEKLREYNV